VFSPTEQNVHRLVTPPAESSQKNAQEEEKGVPGGPATFRDLRTPARFTPCGGISGNVSDLLISEGRSAIVDCRRAATYEGKLPGKEGARWRLDRCGVLTVRVEKW